MAQRAHIAEFSFPKHFVGKIFRRIDPAGSQMTQFTEIYSCGLFEPNAKNPNAN
jgi:hypothetical protein